MDQTNQPDQIPETKLPNRGRDDRFKLDRREIVMIVIAVVALVISGWYAWRLAERKQTESRSINSYQECVAAGNPVMESYPEQCSANGQTFTNTAQKVVEAEDNFEKYRLQSEEYVKNNKFKLSGDFLKIEKYGVKLPLAETSMLIVKDGETDEYVYITPKSITGSGCTLAAVSQFMPGERIKNVDGTDTGSIEQKYQEQSDDDIHYVKVASKYYYLEFGNGGVSCFANDLEGMKAHMIGMRDLKQAFPLLESL
ncbi:MAG: hypothetical protein M3Q36_04000 [bacterium]|nr:hypothetical protein [bacterium]